MIVMFSARRLKPGAWDQFRRAWDPGDAKPPGFQRAYHARNIRDEDEIISFGLFDMTTDDYHAWLRDSGADENQRVDRLSAFVENEHVAGVFEVIDTLDE
jgi:heme-degrading monooxygenase HmoA